MMSYKHSAVAQVFGLMLSVVSVLGQTPSPPPSAESKILSAETSYYVGLGLVRKRTKESLQAALLEFTEARRLCSQLGDKRNEARALNEIASIYAYWGDNRRALDHHNLALTLRQAINDRAGEAMTLNNIGKVYSNLGDKRKAIEYYSLALQSFKDSGDQRSEATILNNIGSIHSDLGENHEALEYFDKSLPLSAGDKRGEGRTLSNIGGVYSNLGDKLKALGFYARALTAFEEAQDRRGTALVLNNIGKIHADLGQGLKALDYYEKSLALRIATDDKPGEATTLNNIGEVYSTLGEKQKSLSNYDLALAAFRSFGDERGQGTILNNIGSIYATLGENEKALDYFNLALQLRVKTEDRKGEARTLSNIGSVYSDMGQSRRALQYYGRALSIRGEIGDRAGQAVTLANIGGAYSALSDNEKAVEYLNRSLLLSRLVGDRRGEATTLNNLGIVSSGLGNNRKALDYLHQAMLFFRAVGDRHGEATALGNMMVVWADLGDLRWAALYGKQSVNLYQSLRSDIQDLDENLKQRFLGTVDEVYRRLAEILIRQGRLSETERVLRMLKEEEYFEFVSRDGNVIASLDERIGLNPVENRAVEADDSTSRDVDKIYREIEKLKTERLEMDSSGSPGERAQAISDRKAELQEQLRSTWQKLKGILTDLRQEFAKEKFDSITLETGLQSVVKGWNDPQTAVVSTVVGHDKLSLIVTTPEFQRGYVIANLSEEKLKGLVANLRFAITKARFEKSDPRPAAQELYNALIKPIEKDLEAAKIHTLVWSLDKFLRYVPVSALWDKDKGYIAQKYASVVLALASRQNLAFRPANKSKWRALGVGMSKKAGDLEALTNVPAEIQAIVRDPSVPRSAGELPGIFAGRQLLDEKFTLPEFRKSLGSYRFTHAATHFVFVSGTKAEGLNSYLLLGDGGKLTLSQVQNSDNIFAGVELLTLSACDTGFGGKTADGREIEGLGALAQRKGARAIMATLWGVADESTSDLMVQFYKNYKKPDLSKAEALRLAQLDLLGQPDLAAAGRKLPRKPISTKNFSHPFYWSPFILIGNWR